MASALDFVVVERVSNKFDCTHADLMRSHQNSFNYLFGVSDE